MYVRGRFVAHVDVEDQTLKLERAEPPLSIEIRKATEAEECRRVAKGQTLCIVVLNKQPTKAIVAWMKTATDPKPAGFKEFVAEAERQVFEAADKATRIVRWRANQRTGHSHLLKWVSLEGSVDRETWEVIGPTVYLHSTAHIVQRILPTVVEGMAELWNRNAEEPLAHELFQEAWTQREHSPRSALVMAVAAAETAMKQAITTAVPDATWLIENVQSPPLKKMLQEYLPLLPMKGRVDGTVLPPPAELLDLVEKAVHLRNQIVHGQDVTTSVESMSAMMNGIHDLLFLIDAYSGELWAEDMLSHALREHLRQHKS